MLKIFLVLLCLISGPRVNTHLVKKNRETLNSQNPTSPTPVIVKVIRDEKSPEEAAEDKAKTKRDFRLNLAIAIAAGVQAFAAVVVFGVYFKQSKLMTAALAETRRSNTAAELAQRPFIVVEVREGRQFWIVNKGKSPARFHFFDAEIKENTVVIDDLPNVLDYGHWYGQPHVRQNNVPWLGAGDERFLGEAYGYEVIDMKNPPIGKTDTVVYGGIKYGGLDGAAVYETTYFYYATAGRQFVMTGRHGWNRNT
jgi:hypothetical protein